MNTTEHSPRLLTCVLRLTISGTVAWNWLPKFLSRARVPVYRPLLFYRDHLSGECAYPRRSFVSKPFGADLWNSHMQRIATGCNPDIFDCGPWSSRCTCFFQGKLWFTHHHHHHHHHHNRHHHDHRLRHHHQSLMWKVMHKAWTKAIHAGLHWMLDHDVIILQGEITVPFNNMQNLKFKSPPMVAFSQPSINVVEVLENE